MDCVAVGLSGWNCAMSRDWVATGEAGGEAAIAGDAMPPPPPPPMPSRLRRTRMLKLPICAACMCAVWRCGCGASLKALRRRFCQAAHRSTMTRMQCIAGGCVRSADNCEISGAAPMQPKCCTFSSSSAISVSSHNV